MNRNPIPSLAGLVPTALTASGLRLDPADNEPILVVKTGLKDGRPFVTFEPSMDGLVNFEMWQSQLPSWNYEADKVYEIWFGRQDYKACFVDGTAVKQSDVPAITSFLDHFYTACVELATRLTRVIERFLPSVEEIRDLLVSRLEDHFFEAFQSGKVHELVRKPSWAVVLCGCKISIASMPELPIALISFLEEMGAPVNEMIGKPGQKEDTKRLLNDPDHIVLPAPLSCKAPFHGMITDIVAAAANILLPAVADERLAIFLNTIEGRLQAARELLAEQVVPEASAMPAEDTEKVPEPDADSAAAPTTE